MNRKRDRLANWFGLRSRHPKQNELHDDASRRKLEAEVGAETVASSVDARSRSPTERDAESQSSKDPEYEQDAENGLQDRTPQSVWQMAWDSLAPSDRLPIETVVKASDSGKDIFSDLERIAQQRKQKLHGHRDNDENQPIRDDPARVRLAVSRIITCLRRFKEVGDIAVSFDPTHAALPWAAFRFILEAVTVNDEQRDLLFSGLERVSFLGLRVKVYEQLYLSKPLENGHESIAQLKQGLVALCGEMLTFMAMAIKRLSKTIIAHTMAALFDPLAVSDVLTSINFKASQVDIEASNCERFFNLRDQKRLRDLINDKLINIDARIEEQWVRLLEAERSELLQWLSPIHYASDHEFAKRGRVDDTGTWLLKRKEFSQWEKSKVSEIFWLHGIPGAGKTKLTSKVIDYAETHLDKSHHKEVLVYFYCDRNRSDHQEPASVVGSFIRQLSADTDNDEDICKIVEEKWRLAKKKGFPSKGLSFETCKQLLPMLVAARAKTVMILDGLDECDKETRHELVYLLKKLTEDRNYLLKVFISSREDRDLFKTFINRAHLRVQANDNADDIKTYVLSQLQDTPNAWFRERLSPELESSILQTFVDKSDGMFQWAVLQMHDLLKLKRASDIKEYLGKLPVGLKKAYERILNDIGDQAGSAPIIAARALRWIMDSAEPLSPGDLVAMVCNSSDGLMPHDPDIDIEFLLEACHNLVVIMGSRATREACRFAHLSVQEYLESHDWPNKPDSQLLGAVCLRLLMASKDIFSTTVWRDYAVNHWHKHLIECDPASREATSVAGHLLSEFLGAPTDSSHHYRKWWATRVPDSCDCVLPPEWAAFGAVALGLRATVARWIRDGILDPGLSSPHHCLLHLAVEFRNLAMCSCLLEAGADINDSIGSLGTALLRAVNNGNLYIIEFLVKQPGIDLNCSTSHETPLLQAVQSRRVAIVKLLVEQPGININYSPSHETPLLRAVNNCDWRIVDLLVAQPGIDVNFSTVGRETPLLRAVLTRHLSIIKCLVNHPQIDADKGRDISGASALCNAVAMRDCKVVELLLDAGANPDLMEEFGDSQGSAYNGFTPALHLAASESMINIVRTLIQKGADVNLVASQHQTPLTIAVRKQCEDVVQCLIQNGADVNLCRPLYHSLDFMSLSCPWYQCLDFTGVKINNITMALIDGGALDYVIDLPRAERTKLDEGYDDMIDWLDEVLAKTDKERRKRRSIRLSDAGAFRTIQGDERRGSERGGDDNGESENAEDRSVRSF